ncbi:transposase family protein [Streptomyces phytophilus]|uniref:transposase family protein n=1 Tax=Streptomyces phytophilus TaxID=722715 RepID=UPI002867F153|nr:transposase family protein [Streptomyces phytophilus]
MATQRRTGKAERRNYSGKHHHHGLHFLALTDERGRLIWISAARPGRTPRQHRRPPESPPGPPARRRPRGPGGPRLPRPGQRRTQSRDHHRLPLQPHPQAHPRPEDRQPRHRRRPRTGRTRLRPTSRTGGSSPSSAPIPLAPPTSCAPCLL